MCGRPAQALPFKGRLPSHRQTFFEGCRFLKFVLANVGRRQRDALVEHDAELRIALDHGFIAFGEKRTGCAESAADNRADASALTAARNRADERARRRTAAYKDRVAPGGGPTDPALR